MLLLRLNRRATIVVDCRDPVTVYAQKPGCDNHIHAPNVHSGLGSGETRKQQLIDTAGHRGDWLI